MALDALLAAIAANAVSGKDWAYCNMNSTFDETKNILGDSYESTKGTVSVVYMNASDIVEGIKTVPIPSIVVLEELSTKPVEKAEQQHNISEVLLRGNYGASIIIPHNFHLNSHHVRRQAVENRIVWVSVD